MDAVVLNSIQCLPMIKMDLLIPQDSPTLASQRPVSQVSLDAVRSASTIKEGSSSNVLVTGKLGLSLFGACLLKACLFHSV